jgi:hypothetical protein
MFAVPDSLSHVTSAAFAQARLRLGSGSAQARLRPSSVSSGLLTLFTRHGAVKTHLTRKSSTFNEGPEKAPPALVRDPKYVTDRRGDSDSGGCFRPPVNFTY